MPGDAIDTEALVDDFLADLRFAARGGEGAATLVGKAGVENKADKAEQISNRLRLEHHGIGAGIERARLARAQGLPDGFASDARGVELGDIEVVAQEVARAITLLSASGQREANQACAPIGEVAVLAGVRGADAMGLVEAGPGDILFLAGSDHGVDGFSAFGR